MSADINRSRYSGTSGSPSRGQIGISSWFTLSQAITGPKAGTNQYTGRDLLSTTRGKHTLSMGGEGGLEKDFQLTSLDNYGVFAFATSAKTRTMGIDLRITKMKAYRDAALWLAKLVAAQPGTVRVQPLPPPTNMFHCYLRVPPDTLARRVTAIAKKHGVWTIARTSPTAIDGITKWEISAGDAALALGPDRARRVLEQLLAPMSS